MTGGSLSDVEWKPWERLRPRCRPSPNAQHQTSDFTVSNASGAGGTIGTVTHTSGTLAAKRLIIGDNAGSGSYGTYSISGSAVLSQVSTSDPFQLGNKNSGTVSTFSVAGNTATISLGIYSIANNAVQEFVFNASGISTVFTNDIVLDSVNGGGGSGVVGGDLKIDLTNYVYSSPTSFTLINSANGLSVGETFNSVTFTGTSGYTANVTYDTTNHDVILNLVPEPATCLMVMMGGFGMVCLMRRRK